jgi:hypothetical protein
MAKDDNSVRRGSRRDRCAGWAVAGLTTSRAITGFGRPPTSSRSSSTSVVCASSREMTVSMMLGFVDPFRAAHDLLLFQPMDEGLNRGEGRSALRRQRLVDLLDRAGALGPQDLQDLEFGSPQPWRRQVIPTDGADETTRVVLCKCDANVREKGCASDTLTASPQTYAGDGAIRALGGERLQERRRDVAMASQRSLALNAATDVPAQNCPTNREIALEMSPCRRL